MGAVPARPRSTQPSTSTAGERLEALVVLRARAHERLAQSPGFLASLDDEAIAAHLASDDAETLGTWPDQKG